MDKILFQRMAFYGYHGVYEAEAQLGQRFFADVELSLDLSRAGKSDQLEHTVNYAEIYEVVKSIVEGERYKLVEALTERIARQLLHQFSIEEVKVRVTKPDPPIRGHYEAVAVEIIRKRADR